LAEVIENLKSFSRCEVFHGPCASARGMSERAGGTPFGLPLMQSKSARFA
jgi:hypothetical protein